MPRPVTAFDLESAVANAKAATGRRTPNCSSIGSVCGRGNRLSDRSQPIAILRGTSPNSIKEDSLNLSRHRSTFAGADRHTFHLSDWRDFRGGSRKEGLVGCHEVLSPQWPNLYRPTKVSRNPNHRVACNTEQDRRALVIRPEHAIPDDKQILS